MMGAASMVTHQTPNTGMKTLLKGGVVTMTGNVQRILAEKNVTYTLNLDGQIPLIENVPARVNEETGSAFELV
jgi:hypothetical protein